MALDLDLKCGVSECNRTVCITSKYARDYCSTHLDRYNKYHNPTPIRACYACGKPFIWIDVTGSGKTPYCRECLPLVIEYQGFLPKNRNRIMRHGITITEYLEMLVGQGFSCACCRFTWEMLDRGLCIDHDHKCCPGQLGCSKCVRGLICNPCNYVVGVYEKYPNILTGIPNYVANNRITK